MYTPNTQLRQTLDKELQEKIDKKKQPQKTSIFGSNH